MRGNQRGFTLVELMVVIGIISILTTILLPNFVRARSQGRLTACTTNLKNIATACETYAANNGTRYPTVLAQLPANQCINAIPTCPSAGSATPYIDGFVSASNPDAYTISCQGNFHGELGMSHDYPKYSAAAGLLEH